MTRRFPVPGDERVNYFFPYIYMGDGDYFYFVTPVGSFRVNQSFDSFAFKLGVSITIGLLAGAVVWHHFYGVNKKESSKSLKKNSVPEVVLESKEPTNLVKMVKKRWSEADVVVKKDFGRLAPSLSVMRSESKEERHPIYMSMNLKRSKGLKVEKLDKIDVCRAVTKALYSALGRSSEEQTALTYLDTPEQVIDHIKRSDPVLFGVLRAVNQSVIMPAIFHLTLDVLKTPMPVLDKPGFDCWLVEVDVSSSGILVRHSRWARSTSDKNSKDYFEFRWILAIGLDLNAQNMTSCELSVVDFKPGSNMTDADRERICSLLGFKV